MVMSVQAMCPAALFGNGLEYLGGRLPTLFGCLRQISVSESMSVPCHERFADLLVPLDGHSTTQATTENGATSFVTRAASPIGNPSEPQ